MQFIKLAKIIGIVLLPVVGVPLMCVLGFMIAWHIDENKIFSEEKFDSAKWIALEQEFHPVYGWIHNDSCDRGKMADDLANNYLKQGMKKNDVYKLLGAPNNARIYSKYRLITKQCISYSIGFCKWNSASSIFLVCFNKNNKVNDYFRSERGDLGEAFELELLN